MCGRAQTHLLSCIIQHMSAFLWKSFLEDDLDTFRQTLASANYVGAHGRPAAASTTALASSPGHTLASSPTLKSKGKARRGLTAITISRGGINSRNGDGVTLLHCVASSASDHAYDFALALLEIPFLDLYVQDLESGWTALHRALYEGNIRMAQTFMEYDLLNFGSIGSSHAGGLIKIKDREGNSPFDLYATTVASREVGRPGHQLTLSGADSDGTTDTSSEDAPLEAGNRRIGNVTSAALTDIGGDEVYTFGSNKNLNLGVGNEDDRHFPERVILSRPACLLRGKVARTDASSLSSAGDEWTSPGMVDLNKLPASVKFRPLQIQEIRMAKYHTAVLTSDAYANLHVCGFGPGGRLGTGDFSTCYRFISVVGGGLDRKRVAAVALGQNHTLAVTDHGEVFSWGSNAYGQLGLTNLPPPSKDEEPLQLLPRQIFGNIKREQIIGCGASALHSVIFSSAALFTFGKNEGQLGLVDANAASLKTQNTPRRVAASLFSSAIVMVSAIDHATVCLLQNHEVWIFANYGYSKISFEFDNSIGGLATSSLWRRYMMQTSIVKVCSGGDTVCALSDRGEVFTLTVKSEKPPRKASTTNPNKIRGLLSLAHRIWSPRKSHMAAHDVDVSQDGSIIVCTHAGSVWRRMRRAVIQDPDTLKNGAGREYKFSRVPSLSRVTAVRSNAFEAFAAVRHEDDVVKSQVRVSPSTLWHDLAPLLPLWELLSPDEHESRTGYRPAATANSLTELAGIRDAIVRSKDIEADLSHAVSKLAMAENSTFDVKVGTTTSVIRIPCHEFILSGRSQLLRNTFTQFRQDYYHCIPDVLSIEYDGSGAPVVLFKDVDLLTLINIIFFIYADGILNVWNCANLAPRTANRYRQVRLELVKLAAQLQLKSLEQAARLVTEPAKVLHQDLENAIRDASLFDSSDVEIVLNGSTAKAHSAMLQQRCPFFEGLFHGRAAGGWLRSRRADLQEPYELIRVDLEHVEPRVFNLVLRYLYADTDERMFDDIQAPSLDALLDIILEVMSVANELILDRLAEICQAALAQFVDLRNVCQLLNAVAPCSVTQFKNAALEYICLNLEALLENRLLSELDDDLLIDLDSVVRANQLSAMPTSKSRELEHELMEAHPELLKEIEDSKQARIAAMIARYRAREEALKTSRVLRRGSEGKAQSPKVLPKRPSSDMVFEMDEDNGFSTHRSPRKGRDQVRRDSIQAYNIDKSFSHTLATTDRLSDLEPSATSPGVAGVSNLPTKSPRSDDHRWYPEQATVEPGKGPSLDARAAPWRVEPLDTPKLNMKQIMAQASAHQESNMSAAISKDKARSSPAAMRLSQKERKRQFQQQQKQQSHQGQALGDATHDTEPAGVKAAPWQPVTRTSRVSLKDILKSPEDTPETAPPKARVPSAPSLTLRQTVPGNIAALRRSSAEAPAQNEHPTPRRSVSTPLGSAAAADSELASIPTPPNHPAAAATPQSSTPRSVRYAPPSAEPSLQLSMADILAQQQTEKDVLREVTTARRSLREIQEEQAFQEWWDQEEAATRARMEAEEKQQQGHRKGSTAGGRAGRGGRKGGGRGVRDAARSAKGRGRGTANEEGTVHST